jgi:hypothetical protein
VSADRGVRLPLRPSGGHRENILAGSYLLRATPSALRGLSKTRLQRSLPQQLTTAAAINVRRIANWLSATFTRPLLTTAAALNHSSRLIAPQIFFQLKPAS